MSQLVLGVEALAGFDVVVELSTTLASSWLHWRKKSLEDWRPLALIAVLDVTVPMAIW